MSTQYKKSEEVPSRVLAQRLEELAHAIADGKAASSGEFTMRIPAELDRDADLVMMEAAKRLRWIEPTSANPAVEPASAKIPVVIDRKTGAYLRKKGEKP